MLVLSRKLGEVIKVGDDITIKIVEIRGDKVKIGIEAPRNLPVHREEVYREIQAEKASTNRAFLRPDDGEDSAA